MRPVVAAVSASAAPHEAPEGEKPAVPVRLEGFRLEIAISVCELACVVELHLCGL